MVVQPTRRAAETAADFDIIVTLAHDDLISGLAQCACPIQSLCSIDVV
jgi:hypothetical protein